MPAGSLPALAWRTLRNWNLALRVVLGVFLQAIGLLVAVSIAVVLKDLRLGTSIVQNVFVFGGMFLIAATGVFLVVLGDRIRRG